MTRAPATFQPLADAVAEHVRDGDELALEGFTHLIPVAAGQEIIRQRKRDLTLVRMTPDIVYDQLIGAGCARTFEGIVEKLGRNRNIGFLLDRQQYALPVHAGETDAHVFRRDVEA